MEEPLNPPRLRILVSGAGALGGLLGAHLSAAGEEVLLVDTNPARVKLLNEEGLYIAREEEGERHFRVRAALPADVGGAADLILVAVKTYQTEDALRLLRHTVEDETLVLSLQNGIGNAETLARLVGPERVLTGITYHSIQHTGPNRLRYRAGIKPIQIAPFTGRITPTVQAVGEVFRRAGLKTEVVASVEVAVWQKLLHNAVVNPVSALTGLTCREILQDEDLQAFMRELCAEVVAVMRARGIPIVDEEDPYRPVQGSLRALGKNRPSMWQDLMRGQRTEVDAINGAIAAEAEGLGLRAPHNWALTRFIHSRERWKILKREANRALLGRARPRPRPEPSAAPPTPAETPLRVGKDLAALLQEYGARLKEAAERNAVAWASWLAPVEILRALGLTPYFPEFHAELLARCPGADRHLRRTLAAGFSQFLPSAMAVEVGAALAGETALQEALGLEEAPSPRCLLYNAAAGRELDAWFRFHGERCGAPVLGLVPPLSAGDLPDPEQTALVVEEELQLVRRLERLLGRKLDRRQLEEAVAHTSRAAALWEEILALGQHVPCPFTAFDLCHHYHRWLLLRGTDAAVQYLSLLRAELEERVAANDAAVPGETWRLYWEGPPLWAGAAEAAELFRQRRIATVGSTYVEAAGLSALDPVQPLESMARGLTDLYANLPVSRRSAWVAARAEALAADGLFCHEARTAPEHSGVRYGLAARLQAEAGLPSVVLEADTHDRRLFAPDELERRLEEFLERLAQGRGKRAAAKTQAGKAS